MLITTIVALIVTAPSAAVTVTPYKTFPSFRTIAVASSTNAAFIAVATEDHQVRIVNTKTMATAFQLIGHPQPVYGIEFSRDGKYLLTGDETARIWMWDAKTGKKIREFPRTKGHTKGIESFTFAPNGKTFASVGKDDVIKVWNLSGGDPIASIEGKGANFYGSAFLPTGALVTGTLAEGMRLYGPTYGLAAKMTLVGGQGANGIAVNSTGTIGLTAGRDGKVTVFDLKSRAKLAAMPGHNDWVTAVAVAPNGKVGASSSTDASVVLWDLKSYKQIASISNRAFVDSIVAFTSDGKYLLTTDASNALQVFQVNPPQK